MRNSRGRHGPSLLASRVPSSPTVPRRARIRLRRLQSNDPLAPIRPVVRSSSECPHELERSPARSPSRRRAWGGPTTSSERKRDHVTATARDQQRGTARGARVARGSRRIPRGLPTPEQSPAVTRHAYHMRRLGDWARPPKAGPATTTAGGRATPAVFANASVLRCDLPREGLGDDLPILYHEGIRPDLVAVVRPLGLPEDVGGVPVDVLPQHLERRSGLGELLELRGEQLPNGLGPLQHPVRGEQPRLG